MRRLWTRLAAASMLIVIASSTCLAATLEFDRIGRFTTGLYDEAAAEIVAWDPASGRLFVVGAVEAVVRILDLSQPEHPVAVGSIDASPFGGGVNSAAVHDGLVAIAVQADPPQLPGRIVFTDIAGHVLGSVAVGALPDMVTFTPDGSKVLVANEGEPDGTCAPGLEHDPEGTVSIIDVSGGVAGLTAAQVTTVRFDQVPAGVRDFYPNSTPAQDMEPEYVAVAPNSKVAWVTLQENNAIAQIDLASGHVDWIKALGEKDHRRIRNAFDASDRDDAVNLRRAPVSGLYMPDAIAAYSVGANQHLRHFLVTANEGDARDYDCFGEEARVASLDLDPTVFPNAATLQENGELGRLNVSEVGADPDGDGDVDKLYTLGGRSLSIWNDRGNLVWDSGAELEKLVRQFDGDDNFNSDNAENDSADSRSDNKGPEPEGVTIGTIGDRTYAFLTLERQSAIVAFDITNPKQPTFAGYASGRDFTGNAEDGTAGDLGPEGILFIPADESPNGRNLLVTANEVSGSVAIFAVRRR